MLGKYSYAMYVVHPLLHDFIGVPLLAAMLGAKPASLLQSLLYALSVLSASLAVAWLSYHLIEKQFLGLKRFFVAEAPASKVAPA